MRGAGHLAWIGEVCGWEEIGWDCTDDREGRDQEAGEGGRMGVRVWWGWHRGQVGGRYMGNNFYITFNNNISYYGKDCCLSKYLIRIVFKSINR